jgi:cell division protein FtsW (lipid II flippase)
VRSNWIGAIFTLTLWLLFTQFKSFRKKIGLVAGVIILSVVIQFFDMYGNSGLEADSVLSAITGTFSSKYTDLLVTQRVSALSNPFEEYSLLSRIALWRYIIALSVDPLMALLGRGVGVLNADSLYFTYLAEFGYPGIIFIAFLIICFCYKATVLLNQSKDTRVIALARGIAVMNIVFAVINITGTHIHSFPGDIYFWFWNGVLIGLISNQNVLAANGDYETACYT